MPSTRFRRGSTRRCSFRPRAAATSTSRNGARAKWAPAIYAAGIEPARRIYDLRHTYATTSLAAGISLFVLSRRMGTSLKQIDDTYGHLAPDAEEHELRLLDSYDAAFGHAVGTQISE